MPRIDIRAPLFGRWRLTLLAAMVLGFAAENYPRPGFWSSYAFDIAGPAGAYIICRGLHYRRLSPRPVWRKFTPEVAAAFVIGFCFLLEAGQYFGLYHGHFDPYDLVAYVVGVLPCYFVDRWSTESESTEQAEPVSE